jgi:two-component system sensor kinase FixL
MALERQQTHARTMMFLQERSKRSHRHLAGELGTQIAHEVNQPLTALMNYLQSIKRLLRTNYGEMPESIDTLIEKTITEAERAASLVRQFRDYLETDELNKAPAGINGVIMETCDILQPQLKSNQISLDLDLQHDIPAVSMDKMQIQEVLIHVIHNGIEAIGEGAKRNIHIMSRCNDDVVTVSVRDSGPGISQDALEILSSASTTNENGFGFGLSICKSIIGAHDGQWWFSEGLEGGAIYNFTLPVDLPH